MTDTVTPTLKPCPFCGAAGTIREDDDPGYPFYATFDHEQSCPMYAVPTDLFLSGAIPTDVERLWNQRAAEATQAAEIARLRETAQKVIDKADRQGSRCVLGGAEPDTWEDYQEVPQFVLDDLVAALSAQPSEKGCPSCHHEGCGGECLG